MLAISLFNNTLAKIMNLFSKLAGSINQQNYYIYCWLFSQPRLNLGIFLTFEERPLLLWNWQKTCLSSLVSFCRCRFYKTMCQGVTKQNLIICHLLTLRSATSQEVKHIICTFESLVGVMLLVSFRENKTKPN